jgi:hypothetical protein
MIPCLCTLYFNSNGICYAQTLGSFFMLFRALFWSYHNIFIWFAFGSFDCYLHLLEVLPSCHPFCLQSLILNIVWFPPTFCPWICACVFTLFGPCTPWGGTLTIGLLSLSAHFGNGCQWGRRFEGLKGIGLHALVLFLSICLACFAWLSIYSGNSTNNFGWQYMQWIQVHSHVHRLWGSLHYIWWFY